MSVVIVVGAQWGDEGKGKVVDLLTERAQVVARWGGGANAGHTLVVAGKKYVTHLIPSGVLRPGVTCVLGEGMVIDPRTLLEEMRTFQAAGLLASPTDLVIAGRAHVVLPHHREIDARRGRRGRGVRGRRRGDQAVRARCLALPPRSDQGGKECPLRRRAGRVAR